ncbi:hypothetical protein ZIOFF_042285 [Zingiber officinale]|uniref:Dof-type domain-containing protein n=1 Tax=Zingiber officinale TaxID=94328 RepID=A0A8J5GIW2_ZINOF|nr:hypothetical protein ZIOFF_042285 [Zingiber officinale]
MKRLVAPFLVVLHSSLYNPFPNSNPLPDRHGGGDAAAASSAKFQAFRHRTAALVAAVSAREEALPCPRCKSRETKFCYFNNYNVNQPRHFCKACHRYWTAGGALRNVPVGAGRRRGRPIHRSSMAAASGCVGVAAERWILRQDAPARIGRGIDGAALR